VAARYSRYGDLKADTAAATADLYTRLIAIASADSQPQVASQYAARAVQNVGDSLQRHCWR